MRYRTKLYLFFLGFTTLVLACSLSFLVHQSREKAFAQIQTEAIAISAVLSAVVDGDLLEQIKTKEDEAKPSYALIRDQLRAVRNVNRTDDIYVKFIYTVYPDPKDKNKFYFGVDAEESEKDKSHAGDVADGATEDFLSEHINQFYSYHKLVADQWGTWLTGYAPIYNSQHQYVGSIGTDLSVAFVDRVLNRLLFYELLAIGGTLLVTFCGAYFLAKYATTALALLEVDTQELKLGHWDYRVDLKTKDEFQDLANSLNTMAEGLQERERLKTGFARYVSQHVMEKLVASKELPKLEGEKRKITVFFSDICGFTKIAEKMSPEQVVSMLNEYFNVMLEIVFKHHGLLDKLIGDAIMLEFGVLEEDPNQEKNAVLTAIDMQQALVSMRAQWKMSGKPELKIGVGIHTGDAIVGTVGSERRMEFTAIGNTVNIAAQIEHLTREFQQDIIVSEETFKSLVKEEFQCELLKAIQLEGEKTPINVYAVFVPK